MTINVVKNINSILKETRSLSIAILVKLTFKRINIDLLKKA